MRLIDADAYAAEMKKRQDACKERIDNPTGDVYTDGEHWGGVFAAFVEAKLTLDAAPTIGGWISVKDRLPAMGQICLLYDGKCAVVGKHITNGVWVKPTMTREPTHWMPLQKPPEDADHGAD